MFIFCNHKLGKIENDGYQYCKKCGKASFCKFIAPAPECEHIFIDVDSYSIKENRYGEKITVGCKKIVKCTKCGIYKSFVFNVDTKESNH